MLRHFPTPPSKQQLINFQGLAAKKTQKAFGAKAVKAANTIIIERGKLHVQIPTQNILYVKAEHVYCRVFFTNGQQVIQRISLEKILRQLPQERFLRIHRSYVINLVHVQKFTSKKVFIGDMIITIGRTWRDQVAPYLKSFMG